VTNDPAESRGHGLGMTIVKEICAEHDWSLEILSTPQTGVLFRITLTMS
jgi:signal transduction histidine kinase